MKKILLILSFIGSILSSNSQNFVEVTVWKAEARSGGTYIGIAEDEIEAENVIEEIDYENQGTKYAIVGKDIGKMKVNIFDKETVAEDFISDHRELEYKYISEIEMISLEYTYEDNVDMAVQFYKNASRIKNESIIKGHLTKLHENYSKYIFNKNESVILVGYSE